MAKESAKKQVDIPTVSTQAMEILNGLNERAKKTKLDMYDCLQKKLDYLERRQRFEDERIEFLKANQIPINQLINYRKDIETTKECMAYVQAVRDANAGQATKV